MIPLGVKLRIFKMFLLFLFIFFISFGCSPDVENQTGFLIVDKETVQFSKDEKVLEGVGRVLFQQPLFGLYSKELYFIKTELFHENSSLVLHSHFSGFVKEDGIKVSFIRDVNSLIIKVSTPAYPVQELYKDEDYFVRNQMLEIYTEVHNGTENFISVKVWSTYINPSGSLKKSTPFLSQQNLIVDSGDTLFYSKGQGMLWGVSLNKVRLIKITRESLSQK